MINGIGNERGVGRQYVDFVALEQEFQGGWQLPCQCILSKSS